MRFSFFLLNSKFYQFSGLEIYLMTSTSPVERGKSENIKIHHTCERLQKNSKVWTTAMTMVKKSGEANTSV